MFLFTHKIILYFIGLYDEKLPFKVLVVQKIITSKMDSMYLVKLLTYQHDRWLGIDFLKKHCMNLDDILSDYCPAPMPAPHKTVLFDLCKSFLNGEDTYTPNVSLDVLMFTSWMLKFANNAIRISINCVEVSLDDLDKLTGTTNNGQHLKMEKNSVGD